MSEYVIRFLVGGAVVSAFSMLGDMLKPKSFAGLFGAAPSVALATLGIAIYQHGPAYAGSQSLTMMAGALRERLERELSQDEIVIRAQEITLL